MNSLKLQAQGILWHRIHNGISHPGGALLPWPPYGALYTRLGVESLSLPDPLFFLHLDSLCWGQLFIRRLPPLSHYSIQDVHFSMLHDVSLAFSTLCSVSSLELLPLQALQVFHSPLFKAELAGADGLPRFNQRSRILLCVKGQLLSSTESPLF